MDPKSLAQLFDHTNLKATATPDDIAKLCDEAVQWQMFGVCVEPWYVSQAHKRLAQTEVKVVTVVGFPLGANLTSVKVEEAKAAQASGADELDWVIAISAMQAEDYGAVLRDLDALTQFSGVRKVILETCYLKVDAITKLSTEIASREIDFVKTSTGFGAGGATLEAVQAMKTGIAQTTFPAKIKASGGIRTLADCQTYIEGGVHRIGASATVSILKELNLST